MQKELGTSSCFCGPVVTVGVNEKGVMSKGTGGFPVSSFATLVKTQKRRCLEHDDFISHTTLLQYEKPSLTTPPFRFCYHQYSQGSVRHLLQFTVNNNIPDRLVFLNTVTLLCLIQFFQTHSWHRITHFEKKQKTGLC